MTLSEELTKGHVAPLFPPSGITIYNKHFTQMFCLLSHLLPYNSYPVFCYTNFLILLIRFSVPWALETRGRRIYDAKFSVARESGSTRNLLLGTTMCITVCTTMCTTMCVCVFVCVCVCACVYTCMCVCTYVYVYVYVCKFREYVCEYVRSSYHHFYSPFPSISISHHSHHITIPLLFLFPSPRYCWRCSQRISCVDGTATSRYVLYSTVMYCHCALLCCVVLCSVVLCCVVL